MAVDLSSYGLNWTLDPDTMTAVPGDFLHRIRHMTMSDDQTTVMGAHERYNIGNQLGKGTYGTVYEAQRASDGMNLVVKVFAGEEVRNVVKETLINILVVRETEHISHPDIHLRGPFAPRIYDFGYDPVTGECFIVSEKMRNTVLKALNNGSGDPVWLEAFFKTILVQLPVILEDVGRLLNFNHRDFKTDNCMYVRDPTGEIQIRLIDFGFSCITYDSLYIDGGGYYFRYCRIPSRDMSQFLYEMYKYHPYLPHNVRELLEALLTFKMGRTVCKMYEGCKEMTTWRDTYTFLNDKAIVNPNCDPANLVAIARAFYAGRPWRPLLASAKAVVRVPVAKPAVPVVCPAGKVYNPDTRRCVGAEGAVGRRLLAAAAAALPAVGPAAIGIKPCPADKPDYNPKTKRCLKACPPGQRRTAPAFKCKATVAAVKAVAAAPVVVCPPAKPDYNPKTRRCNKACPPGMRRNATFKCVR